MDPLRVIALEFGVFLTTDAYAWGHNDRSIARAVHGRLWHRVRRGAFVHTDVWERATPEERHLILAAAVHRSYGDKVAFSHVTAALAHGIAVWGVDLSRVHVTRLDGGEGRIERDLVHHEGLCLLEGDVVRQGKWLCVDPTRAALETGILGGSEPGLVSVESLLNQGLGSPVEVGNIYDRMQHWPGTRGLQVVVRMADGRAESVGESRTRWMFRVHGVPAPELQYEVRDAHGHLIGVSDFVWLEHGSLGEFDGRQKYGRLLKPGQDPGDVVFAEKHREDELRRLTDLGMVRVIWSELDTPVTTCRRVQLYLDAHRRAA